jgi:myosin heavy subunit
MAAGRSPDLSEICADLCCPLCMERYNDDAKDRRKPVMFHEGQSLCEKCFKELRVHPETKVLHNPFTRAPMLRSEPFPNLDLTKTVKVAILLERECRILLEQLRKSKEENARLQRLLSETEAKLLASHKTIQELKEQNARLTADNKQLEKSKAERAELEKQVVSAQQTVTRFTSHLAQIHQNTETLKKKLADIEQEKQLSDQTLIDTSYELDKTKEREILLIRLLNEARQQNNQYKELISQLTTQVYNLKVEKSRLQIDAIPSSAFKVEDDQPARSSIREHTASSPDMRARSRGDRFKRTASDISAVTPPPTKNSASYHRQRDDILELRRHSAADTKLTPVIAATPHCAAAAAPSRQRTPSPHPPSSRRNSEPNTATATASRLFTRRTSVPSVREQLTQSEVSKSTAIVSGTHRPVIK